MRNGIINKDPNRTAGTIVFPATVTNIVTKPEKGITFKGITDRTDGEGRAVNRNKETEVHGIVCSLSVFFYL